MVEQRYQQYKSQGFETYFVIVENNFGPGPVTPAYCNQVKAQYGLTMPVLYVDDPGPVQKFYGAAGQDGEYNDANMVLSQGGFIHYKSQYVLQSEVEAVIVDLLGL